MTTGEITLWIQAVVVVVAVAASVVALIVSWRDRVASRKIAAEDRCAALERAKLMFDLDVLLKLLEKNNRGGSTDRAEASRMGAEALTFVGMIGPELLPRQWARGIERDDEGLRALLVEEGVPEFVQDAIESQLAINAVLRRIRELTTRQGNQRT